MENPLTVLYWVKGGELVEIFNIYDTETELFLKSNGIKKEKRPVSVKAFLVLSEWRGTSLRSGVWTFYEKAQDDDIFEAAEYLENKGYGEIAGYMLMGIHDYKNPEYIEDCNYPDEWMEEAEKIDRWIFKNEEYISSCKSFLIDVCAETIDFLIRYDYAVSEYCSICGVDTYIIDGNYSQIFEDMGIVGETVNMLTAPYEQYKEKNICLAVVYQPKNIEKYRWLPVLCYKNGNEIYHVHFHDGWVCRKCMYNNGPVIMPMVEADASYYSETEKPYPAVPQIFKKVKCKNCGQYLQNHLIGLY